MTTLTKAQARLRRSRRSRSRIATQNIPRVSVTRTPRHITAQLFSADGTKVLAQASSIEKELRGNKPEGGKVGIAEAVGELLGQRAMKAFSDAKMASKIAFDRSGYGYHGRVRALADALRKQGLEF